VLILHVVNYFIGCVLDVNVSLCLLVNSINVLSVPYVALWLEIEHTI